MRIAVLMSVCLLSVSTGASASRRCQVDLGPLVSARFDLTLIDEATIERLSSSGEILVSKGGAVTMMRTDIGSSGKPIRFFVSGQLDPAQLRQVQRALEDAIPAASSDSCLVESFEDPGNGRSLYGRSELALYRGTQPTLPTLGLRVAHDDVSAAPIPLCPSEVRVLNRALRDLEDALRMGVRPLQCTPYGSRP